MRRPWGATSPVTLALAPARGCVGTAAEIEVRPWGRAAAGRAQASVRTTAAPRTRAAADVRFTGCPPVDGVWRHLVPHVTSVGTLSPGLGCFGELGQSRVWNSRPRPSAR